MRIAAQLAVAALVVLVACNRAPEPPAPDVAADRQAAVQAAVAEHERRFGEAAEPAAADTNTAYQFQFTGLWTERVPMTAFTGEVVLVVNTASECGFTPQYEGLQQIYSDYRARGFEVLGVPSNNFNSQEPGSAEQIQEFCTLNYGVTFPMAGKTEVIGADRHPFYAWAQQSLGDSAVPGWNFHKILIGRDGRAIAAFNTRTEPTSEELRAAIEGALGS